MFVCQHVCAGVPTLVPGVCGDESAKRKMTLGSEGDGWDVEDPASGASQAISERLNIPPPSPVSISLFLLLHPSVLHPSSPSNLSSAFLSLTPDLTAALNLSAVGPARRERGSCELARSFRSIKQGRAEPSSPGGKHFWVFFATKTATSAAAP